MTRAAISIAGNGDTTVMTAETGKVWRIHALVLCAAGTTTVTVKSGSTSLTGAMNLINGVPLCLPFNEHPYLRGNAAADTMILSNGQNIAIGGFIEYEQA